MARYGNNHKGGRPVGSMTAKTREAKSICKNLVDDPEYRASLRKRLIAGTAGPMEVLVWHYAHGRPRELVDIRLGPLLDDLSGLSMNELTTRAEELTRQLREANELAEQLDAIDVTPKAVALIGSGDEGA
jgi:hypothetical protein